MVQFLLFSAVLRQAAPGLILTLLFIAGLIALMLTGSSLVAGLLGATLTACFVLLIVLTVMHGVRFLAVVFLRTAILIKRLGRSS